MLKFPKNYHKPIENEFVVRLAICTRPHFEANVQIRQVALVDQLGPTAKLVRLH